MNNDLALILSIVGVFGTIGIAINGFFLKGIYQELNFLKISFATFVGEKEVIKEKFKNIDEKIEIHAAHLHKLSMRVAELEKVQ